MSMIKGKFKVERSSGDDLLDEMSMRINKKLKTEKKIDDKKENVYFWLFKFCLLIIYLLFINFVFQVVNELGVYLIYTFAVSLRSVLSSIYSFGVGFVCILLNLYILYKNLKIFMASSYYKRLYKNDSEMLVKKKKFFGTVEEILRALSIVCLLVIAVFGVILIALITMMLTLMTKDMFMPSLLVVFIVGFVLCAFIFAEVQKKFLNIPTSIGRKHLYFCLLVFLASIIWFGIDIGYDSKPYNKSNDLPVQFEIEKNKEVFNIKDIDKICLKSDAKFDNIEVHIDNTLDDEMVIETDYFKTAIVSYTKTVTNDTNLLLHYNSDIDFKPSNMLDVFDLTLETIRTETIYNYNMFKYPKIKVYVNSITEPKINVLGYYDNIRCYSTD